MPQATDLTIKNANDVDKTFTLLTPASGYASLAEWALKEGATSVVYPTLSLAAHKTKNRSRKVAIKSRKPATYTSVATGLPVVASVFEVNVTASVPDDFPDDQKDDAVAYATNALRTALIMACMRDGLPGT